MLNKKKLAETQGASANGGARRDSSSPTELQIDLPGWNHFCVDCADISAACFLFFVIFVPINLCCDMILIHFCCHI